MVRELERIWEAHGLGAVRSVVSPRRGGVNRCFIVNEELVIRFDIRGTAAGRFGNEKVAYETLGPSGVPVPEAVCLDESRTLVPYDFLIVTRLRGETAIDSWPSLSEAERCQLATEAGRWQAILHGHTFERFGSLRAIGSGGFPTWRAYLHDYYERYARQASDLGVMDSPTLARITALLERHHSLFESVTTAALLHSDYHFENILQDRGHVTGIIDFEWAHTGDPAFDCRVDDNLEAMCPGSVEPFYSSYQSIRPLHEQHALKARIYRLLLHLEGVVDAARQAKPEWLREEQEKLHGLLAALESES
jgi:aminoglycoside phosphotransferase (APT) family kinase protein